MTDYLPDIQCPKCGRRPNVSYSEAEVHRAKRDRQGAWLHKIQCPRCGRRYWIQARDIAAARPASNGSDPLAMLHPFTRSALEEAGITSMEQLQGRDLSEVRGIGPSREKEIREVLDRHGRAAVG